MISPTQLVWHTIIIKIKRKRTHTSVIHIKYKRGHWSATYVTAQPQCNILQFIVYIHQYFVCTRFKVVFWDTILLLCWNGISSDCLQNNVQCIWGYFWRLYKYKDDYTYLVTNSNEDTECRIGRLIDDILQFALKIRLCILVLVYRLNKIWLMSK